MTSRMINYTQETLPSISEKRLAEMKRRAAAPVDTGEIPEGGAEWFENAVRGRFYRPVKEPVTARLDSDVVAWLKRDGRGYQSRMNSILRREMLASLQANVASTERGRRVKRGPLKTSSL